MCEYLRVYWIINYWIQSMLLCEVFDIEGTGADGILSHHGACNGWWIYTASHWTAKCRKWAASSQIWQGVLNAQWDGCMRASQPSNYSWWLEEIYKAQGDLFTHFGSVLRLFSVYILVNVLYRKMHFYLFSELLSVIEITKQSLCRKKKKKVKIYTFQPELDAAHKHDEQILKCTET